MNIPCSANWERITRSEWSELYGEMNSRATGYVPWLAEATRAKRIMGGQAGGQAASKDGGEVRGGGRNQPRRAGGRDQPGKAGGGDRPRKAEGGRECAR